MYVLLFKKLGGQFINLMDTKVQFGAWQYLRMDISLFLVELIACKAQTPGLSDLDVKLCIIYNDSSLNFFFWLNFVPLVKCSVRLWKVPDPSLMDNESSHKSAKVVLVFKIY